MPRYQEALENKFQSVKAIYLLIPNVKSRPNFVGMTVDRPPGDKETLDFHHGKSRRAEVNLRFDRT